MKTMPVFSILKPIRRLKLLTASDLSSEKNFVFVPAPVEVNDNV